MSGEILAVGRSADGIATEIRVIVQQARTMMATAVIEVGKRLIEAQELVPHGEWGEYVTHSCGFSQRTAQAYMQLAANSANAQTIADLPYSKALALLALPDGKIEEFRAEHPVEDVSVRELKKQIAEYKDRLETVDEENDRLRAELEAAKNRPSDISEMEADEIRSDGWAAGYNQGLDERTALGVRVDHLQKQLEEQSSALNNEHREALASKDEEIAELKRQLAAVSEKGPSGADAALLKNETVAVLLEVQTALNKMHGCYIKANTSAPALRPLIKGQAEKLIASLHSNFDIDYV